MFASIFNKSMSARVNLWSSTWFLIFFFQLIIFLSAYHVPSGISLWYQINACYKDWKVSRPINNN